MAQLHFDDYGLNRTVNQAINTRIMTQGEGSLSVLTTMPDWVDIKKLASRVPKLQLFLHINLVEGRPLSNPRTIKSLVKPDGTFMAKEQLIPRLMAGLINPKDIERELKAQLKPLLSFKKNLVGIDSHQHLHALSPIAEIVETLAKNHKLEIRSYARMITKTPVGKIKKLLFALVARVSHQSYHKSVALPVSWRTRQWRSFAVASWEKVSLQKSNSSMCIVCHPGTTYDLPA